MIDIDDKEFKLLQMLSSRDMDAESAMVLLHVSKNEFDSIIKKLLENELLQYTSFNVIELTELGVSYLSKRGEKENVEHNNFSSNTIKKSSF
jgi:Mn-dependent DtxR family transcriptional regulator